MVMRYYFILSFRKLITKKWNYIMFEKIQALSQSFLSGTPQQFKRYFFSQVPADSRLSFILGSRGVGKTTAILQRLSGFDNNEFSKKILYVPADHIIIGQTTLYDIAEEFYLNGGKLIAFDEIHKYDNWAQEIKSIYILLRR